MKKWVKIKEATDILGISERTIRRRVKDGKLKKKKQNNSVYIEVEVKEKKGKKGKPKKEPETQITKELLGMLRSQIDNQAKTLDNQNKQISEIRDLVQNEQVITRELLGRMPLLKAPEEEIQQDSKSKSKWTTVWTFVLFVLALLSVLGIYYLYYIGVL